MMYRPITQSVGIVDSSESLDDLLDAVAADQEVFAKFSQQQIDSIFTRCALAANQARVKLAQMAVEEGKMGNLEDKVIKNHFSSEFVHYNYRDTKTCGVVEHDITGGFTKFAEPIGVLAGIIPCTNPTSTTIFKALLALKTRNCIVFSPHPRTGGCTIEAAKIIRDAAIAAGAPANCVGWIDVPSIELCNVLMCHKKTVMIIATGAGGLVKAAYSSGKPAFGGGSGNTPVIIDETADIEMAVNSVLLSKTFDNGLICASEQGIIVVESVAKKVKEEFVKRGAYFLDANEKELVGEFILTDNGALNPAAVGQSAWKLARLAGITDIPDTCRLLLAELSAVGPSERLSHEKLCPCLGYFVVKDFEEALERGLQMLNYGGMGHTSVLYTDLNGSEKEDRVSRFQSTMPTGRTLLCMPTSQGAIGNVFNFRQMPSMSLGCGSWGRNATSESLQVKHLLNYKEVCERRQHVLWFKVPKAVYYNRGILAHAFHELATEGFRRAFIVTDQCVKSLGYVDRVIDALKDINVDSDVFAEVLESSDLKTALSGVARMNLSSPDIIVALGGSSVMAAAKIIRLLYEHPDASLDQLHTRFMDMQKRIVKFPKLGDNIKRVICIPTTSGVGSEVTPFALVCDPAKDMVYTMADYSLTPDMAILDADFVLTLPSKLAARGGFVTLVNALESYVSMLSTDYTQGLSTRAIQLIFKHLRKSMNGDAKAREACHNAAAIAGMAYANAFLGICNSLATQLSRVFGIPHGDNVALLICHVIEYNAQDAPSKQGTFPQYSVPKGKEQYAEIADGLGSSTSGDNQIQHPLEEIVDRLDELLEKKVQKLVEDIDDLIIYTGMPRSIQELGISESSFTSQVDAMALEAFDDQCTATNPRYPLISELRELLMKAYYGRVNSKTMMHTQKTSNYSTSQKSFNSD